MSDVLYCFTCSDKCAAETASANRVEDYPRGYTYVRGVEDIVGVIAEDIDYAICRHRWKPATRTAYKHLEACLFDLQWDPDYELGK